MKTNETSGAVVDAAIKVHTVLGPGLLESAYRDCLLFELHKRGVEARKEVDMPVNYEGVQIDVGYKLDLFVDEDVIVECKAVEAIHPVHKAQLLTYLKLSKKKIGLLINFNVKRLKDGITRLAN